MPIKTIKNSFNAGELSEYMAGRTDISKYHNGCSRLINATVLPHGGAAKRPGTEYIAQARTTSGSAWATAQSYTVETIVTHDGETYMCATAHTSDKFNADFKSGYWVRNKSRLIPFEFSVDDTLVLEFSHLKIRFYKDGERVLEDDATVITGATQASPVVITTGGHSFADGDWVRISGVVGMTELNNRDFIVANKDATTFELTDAQGNNIDGTGYGVYSSAGTATTIYEITSPYNAKEIFEIHLTQSADVMYIAHEDHHPQKLSRLSDASWTIADVDFTGGPFLTENTDTTKTLTFTETPRTTGTHDGAANQSGQAGQPVTDSGESWTTNEFAGLIIVNKTDGSWGTIASNTATTITITAAGMANGTDNDFDTNDEFEIYDISIEQGFYHGVGDTGTLTSTGHTPFNANHVGSLWQISKTRTGDNYVKVSGASAAGTSSPVEIKGDFSLDAAGVISGVTVTLERKQGDGDWQDYRKFTAATAYSATEEEDDVYYRINVSGTTDATTNVTLTAKEQVAVGVVEVTAFSTSASVSATVIDKLFRDVESDIDIEGLQYGVATDVEVTSTGHTLNNGDIVLIKNVSRSDFSGLNYDGTENNLYIVTGKTANTFKLANSSGDTTGNAAKQTVGVGEYYIIGNTTASSMWAEGAWSEYRGYPRTVAFFEDRLWWASSTNNPDTLWGSRSSLYEDMSYTSLGADDEAITAPIQDSEVSQIQWMVGKKVMAVGAANKEYRFGASDPDKPTTPSDRKSVPQSSFGSNEMQPVELNDAIFFFQRQGRKLRAMKFDYISEEFKSDDATLLANTMFESPPMCMAAQRVPDSILWVVRKDGVLASFTYEPDEEVSGWARHLTDNNISAEKQTAFFESVSVIHGSTEDEVWVTVRRVVGGYTVRYVERFSRRLFTQIDESSSVDSALIVESPYEAQEIGYVTFENAWNEGNWNEGVYAI